MDGRGIFWVVGLEGVVLCRGCMIFWLCIIGLVSAYHEGFAHDVLCLLSRVQNQ